MDVEFNINFLSLINRIYKNFSIDILKDTVLSHCFLTLDSFFIYCVFVLTSSQFKIPFISTIQ